MTGDSCYRLENVESLNQVTWHVFHSFHSIHGVSTAPGTGLSSEHVWMNKSTGAHSLNRQYRHHTHTFEYNDVYGGASPGAVHHVTIVHFWEGWTMLGVRCWFLCFSLWNGWVVGHLVWLGLLGLIPGNLVSFWFLLARPRSWAIYTVRTQTLPLLSAFGFFGHLCWKSLFQRFMCRAAFFDEYVGHGAADFVCFMSSS